MLHQKVQQGELMNLICALLSPLKCSLITRSQALIVMFNKQSQELDMKLLNLTGSLELPDELGHSPKVLRLSVVLVTLVKTFAPSAEVVVHAPPSRVCATGDPGLCPCHVSGPQSQVAQSPAWPLHVHLSLRVDVFG